MDRTIRSKSDVDRWWQEECERRLTDAAERRQEHFADSDEIPDLEFLTPDCPVCGLATEFEDGFFECPGCWITWGSNGYGHEAIRGVDHDQP